MRSQKRMHGAASLEAGGWARPNPNPVQAVPMPRVPKTASVDSTGQNLHGFAERREGRVSPGGKHEGAPPVRGRERSPHGIRHKVP